MIKKADIILTISLIVLGLAISVFLTFGNSKGDTLVITHDGRLYGTYPLTQNQEITVKDGNHINKITIKGGKVSMNFSNCHNHDCVESHSISDKGETIVCLPHKLVLSIEGGESGYDSISR